jgi:hypothetical protein
MKVDKEERKREELLRLDMMRDRLNKTLREAELLTVPREKKRALKTAENLRVALDAKTGPKFVTVTKQQLTSTGKRKGAKAGRRMSAECRQLISTNEALFLQGGLPGLGKKR